MKHFLPGYKIFFIFSFFLTMSKYVMKKAKKNHILSIVQFVSQCRGLRFLESGKNELTICQGIDEKALTLKTKDIEEVLHRTDANNEDFLQINFLNGKKVILTDSLIGFKPAKTQHLDMSRLPKVVTTPDLISFIEVLEDSLQSPGTSPEEVEDVKQYFHSVLKGAETIGFNLSREKMWMAQLMNRRITSANA